MGFDTIKNLYGFLAVLVLILPFGTAAFIDLTAVGLAVPDSDEM